MLLLAPPETNQDKESCTAYFFVVLSCPFFVVLLLQIYCL
jgi:hypothetical protein